MGPVTPGGPSVDCRSRGSAIGDEMNVQKYLSWEYDNIGSKERKMLQMLQLYQWKNIFIQMWGTTEQS